MQKEAGLPGVVVWYTQVGSKTSAGTILPKMLQRLVDRSTCSVNALDETCGYPESTAPWGMAERRVAISTNEESEPQDQRDLETVALSVE